MNLRKPWTHEHDAILQKYGGYLPDSRIADMTGHYRTTVLRRREALKIPPYCQGTAKYGSWNDLPTASLAAIEKATKTR